MRQRADLGPCVSLVAAQGDVLIGHVFFSPVMLADFPEISVCTLGPMCVHRERQKKGVGSQLIEKGLRECSRLGYKAVFTTGSLEYYPRFGFTPIATTDLRTIFNTPNDMVLELEPGILKGVSGLVDYPPPWHAFLEQ